MRLLPLPLLLSACAVLPARVSVSAGEMEVRVATVDSRLRMPESAHIALSCESSHWSGDIFKPHVRGSHRDVPVTVVRRRDGRDDVFTLSWPDAELVHSERGGRCRMRLQWNGAREDGSMFSLNYGADGEGDQTDGLLAMRADTRARLSWEVRDIHDAQTGAVLRRRCFERLSWTRAGQPVDGYEHEHRLHDGPAACEEAFVAAGAEACEPGQERMTGLGACCFTDQGAGAGESCVTHPDARCLEGSRPGGGCTMALAVTGAAPPDRAHPVLGTLRGVPPGTWTSQVQVYPYEDRTQRRAAVPAPLHMMRSEVTRGMWAAVMAEVPEAPAGCGPACPVTDVSPEQVAVFIERLRERDGEPWRLPTADEWEWAARGGEAHGFSGAATPGPVAWTAADADGPRPVCGKAENGFGLCDLSGNVWELALRDGRFTHEGAAPYEKRGGSWFAGAHQATVFGHHPVAPGTADGGLGFRLVVDAR